MTENPPPKSILQSHKPEPLFGKAGIRLLTKYRDTGAVKDVFGEQLDDSVPRERHLVSHFLGKPAIRKEICAPFSLSSNRHVFLEFLLPLLLKRIVSRDHAKSEIPAQQLFFSVRDEELTRTQVFSPLVQIASEIRYCIQMS